MLEVSRRQFLSTLPALSLLLRPTLAYTETGEISVVVHPSNPTGALSEIELRKIFTTDLRHWKTESIIAFNLPPRSDLRVRFDQVVLDMDPEEAGRFWVDRRVRGGHPPPRTAPDGLMVRRLVAKLGGAIGYLPSELVDRSVRVVARLVGESVRSP